MKYSIEEIKKWLKEDAEIIEGIGNDSKETRYSIYSSELTHENIQKANSIDNPNQGELEL